MVAERVTKWSSPLRNQRLLPYGKKVAHDPQRLVGLLDRSLAVPLASGQSAHGVDRLRHNHVHDAVETGFPGIRCSPDQGASCSFNEQSECRTPTISFLFP